jgi:sensor histidine kinase YesM
VASGDGTRIGIRNTVERLTFLYGDDFELNFSNNIDMGACIELLVPVNPENRKENI